MYQKKLSGEGLDLISPHIAKIEKMHPGDRLRISHDFPYTLKRIRSYLYIWLNQTGKKPIFKTTQESPTSFLVHRKALDPGLSEFLTSSATQHQVTSFVQTHLLECDTLEEARTIALKALEQGKLTDEEFLSVMEEWEAKCALPNHSTTPEMVEATKNFSPFMKEIDAEATKLANPKPPIGQADEPTNPTGSAGKGETKS